MLFTRKKLVFLEVTQSVYIYSLVFFAMLLARAASTAFPPLGDVYVRLAVPVEMPAVVVVLDADTVVVTELST